MQDIGWIFLGNGRIGFDLGLGDFGVFIVIIIMFGDEVIDFVFVVFIVWLLVLDCGIFDFGIIQCDQFYDCGVKLVFIMYGCCIVFQIGDVGVFVGNDQCVFELVCVFCIYVEIG